MAQRKKATITETVTVRDDRTNQPTQVTRTRELASGDWISVPSLSIGKVYGEQVAAKDAELRVLFDATAKVKAEIEGLINAQVPVVGPFKLLFGYRGGIAVAKADKGAASGAKGAASDVQAILKRLA